MAAPMSTSLSDIARILNLNKDDSQAFTDEIMEYFATSDDEKEATDTDEESESNSGE